MLGLGNSLIKGGLTGPTIVTDNLVLKHKYDAGAVVPISDGAAYFNGSSYIKISHDAIDISTTNFTIAAWIMPITGTAQYDCIMAKRDGNNEGFQFDFREAGYNALGIALEDADNAITNAGTAGTVSLNKWQHACVTIDRSAAGTAGAYFYNDGVLDIDSTLSGAMSSIDSGLEGEAPLCIGAKSTDGGSISNQFNGYICNVAFWNAALTQAQIKSIMNKNYAGLSDSEKTNLVSWWNLDSVPYSGNAAHNSSLVGALQYEASASDIGYGNNCSLLDFAPTNDIELGVDIFGGEGTFTTDTGYWTLNSSEIDGGLVITGGDSYNAIVKNSILTDGKIYKLSFDILDYTVGQDEKLRFNWAHTGSGIHAYPPMWKETDGTGSFYCYFKPGGGTIANFVIYVSDSDDSPANYGIIKLDNLVCQEVLNAGVLK